MANIRNRVAVYLTRPQIDALIGACIDAASIDDAGEEASDPERLRRAVIRDRAVHELFRARDTHVKSVG